MSRIQVTWVVKTQNGQIKGPYSTEAILRMIGEGVFSGQEYISKMPDGKWTLISKEPDFYDKLLEALEGVVQVDPDKSAKMEAETVIVPPEIGAPKQADAPKSEPKKIEVLESNPRAVPATNIPVNKNVDIPKPVIELGNIGKFKKQQVMSKSKLPLILGAVAAVLVLVLLLLPTDETSGKISLIAPGKSGQNLTEAQVKEKFILALREVEQDTFESYLRAENQLVSIVEGSPQNLEVRAVLCTVYKELWPFAKQDANDVRVISIVTQTTKSQNVVSPYGNMCESVKLLTSGRFKEARGVIENTLELSERFSLLPILYQIKAELLEADQDLLNAMPYYEKSAQLWDRWLKPQVQLGVLMAKGNKPTEGANILRRVLERNPNHKTAKIQLGLIEYRSFKQSEKAYNLLASAIESKSRISKTLESEAYFVLAQVSVEKGQKSKALNFAQKGFDLNPNNSELRQLVIRLGGTDKVKTNELDSELVFLGDQYMRQGDYLAAQAEYKAAFEADKKNGTAALKAAKCLWALNQSFEAIEWLNKAIKADPRLISAYVLQADYKSQRYDFMGATQVLTNATRLSPNNYEVLRGFALLEFRKNNMGAAVNYGMRSLKAYDADVDTYILLSKASAQLAAGINPIKNSDAEKKEAAQKDAIRFATKAVEIDSTHVEAQITYAKMLAQINGVDSGVSYIRELIKKFSYSMDYRIALAEILQTEERFSQAKDIYEQVTDADPKNKKAWIGLGESQRALGLIDKSLRSFLTAAVLDPTDGEALFQAGKVYLESNRFDQAIQQFRRVQNINPNFPRTNYYIGKAAFASGDFGVALDASKAEKKMNPNLADSYLLAAETYSARKQFSECAAEYSQAMKLRSQGAEIYVRAAQCYRQSGSVDIAEDMLTLALARESGYAEIYKEQGTIYEIKGDAASAVQAYNKYLGLSPNAPDRREIENRMSRLGGR